jgi:hypothetical protein
MTLEKRLKQLEKQVAYRGPSDEQLEEWGKQAAKDSHF